MMLRIRAASLARLLLAMLCVAGCEAHVAADQAAERRPAAATGQVFGDYEVSGIKGWLTFFNHTPIGWIGVHSSGAYRYRHNIGEAPALPCTVSAVVEDMVRSTCTTDQGPLDMVLDHARSPAPGAGQSWFFSLHQLLAQVVHQGVTYSMGADSCDLAGAAYRPWKINPDGVDSVVVWFVGPNATERFFWRAEWHPPAPVTNPVWAGGGSNQRQAIRLHEAFWHAGLDDCPDPCGCWDQGSGVTSTVNPVGDGQCWPTGAAQVGRMNAMAQGVGLWTVEQWEPYPYSYGTASTSSFAGEQLCEGASDPPPPAPPPPPPPPPPGPASGPIIGHVDGVIDVGGSSLLHGWACFVGHAAPIDVHVYAGGPYGSGTIIGAVTTTEDSEPAVHDLCQTPATVRHRFRFALDPHLAVYAGQPLHVHGIVPPGGTGNNDLIGNSGNVTVPSAPAFGPDPPAPGNSCQGHCGSRADTCYCDTLCSQFGDCCGDYAAVCQ